jgi:Mn2+/Fe2+ NRAMP family transporter
VTQAPATRASSVVGPSKPRLWQILGPGLITGAADDDPSGIATYAQAGAQFDFRLGWSLVLTYPLMVVIQAISARIGRTTGHGIAGNLRAHYLNWLLQGVVALLFTANTLNIGADLGAMADATRLLLPAPAAWVYVIIGTGLLSVPVLAGSAAYALGEARRWPLGLARQPAHAKAFYSAIAIATLLSAGANLTALNPVTALIWAAVINGIVAVPVMTLLMLMATRKDVLGEFKISGAWTIVGWMATATMGVSALAFIALSL